MKTVGYIVAGGKQVPCAVPVLNWAQHGLVFPGLAPRKRTDVVTLHWTGAENPAEVMFANLRKRGLSVHFFIGHKGDVWQFNDADANAAHASGMNARAVGIEIQNRANGERLQSGIQRALIRETIHGRDVTYTLFTPAQIHAALSVCAALCETYALPWQVPMEPKAVTRDKTIPPHLALPNGISATAGSNERVQRVIPRQLTDAEFERFRGVLGHFHRTSVGKKDPGLALLEAVAAFEPRQAQGIGGPAE